MHPEDQRAHAGKDFNDQVKQPPKKNNEQEFELLYRNKIEASDLLQNGDGVLPARLKIDRAYRTANRPHPEAWNNLLVFGDNLAFLKTIYENRDPLIKDRVKGQVKLIYIDPPFATGERYDANQGQRAYSAKRVGSDFIEFLRRRLILAHEILADDGLIVVRNAFNYGHYVKIILDEIFSIDHFINEIIINRKRKSMGSLKKYEVAYEYLYVYSKSDRYFFQNQWAKKPLSKIKWTSFLSQEERNPKERHLLGLTFLPPAGQHFSLNQDKTDRLLKEHYLRVKHKPSGAIFYYSESGNDDAFYKKISTKGVNKFKYQDITTETEVYGVRNIRDIRRFRSTPVEEFKVEYLTRDEEKITNDWRDIPSYTDTSGYPTENSEQLLQRIIQSFSQEGDLILDFFAGSGTTAVVAEKLKRRWIAVDMGKLAYFTAQKRLLQIEQSKSLLNQRKSYGQQARPFITCFARLPLAEELSNLKFDTYRHFLAGLFNIELQPGRLGGVQTDGTWQERPVLIFDHLKNPGQRIDLTFLSDLTSRLGSPTPVEVLLVVPASLLDFPTEIFQIDQCTFRFLRIPEQIIKQMHAQFNQVSRLKNNAKKNHDFEEAIGFHLNRPPLVYSRLGSRPGSAQLFVQTFKSQEAHLPAPNQANGFRVLAAIFIDRNYNDRFFRFDLTLFARDLFPFLNQRSTNKSEIEQRFLEVEQQGLTIDLGALAAGRKVMIIYTDIYGNYFREQFTV